MRNTVLHESTVDGMSRDSKVSAMFSIPSSDCTGSRCTESVRYNVEGGGLLCCPSVIKFATQMYSIQKYPIVQARLSLSAYVRVRRQWHINGRVSVGENRAGSCTCSTALVSWSVSVPMKVRAFESCKVVGTLLRQENETVVVSSRNLVYIKIKH